ncbi:hypothetical protein HDU98_001498 [Podochytrium sp. JEL0797]|nr:hypothetical protein HDU98_001498 [Podochytrium sp. JEL0797]
MTSSTATGPIDLFVGSTLTASSYDNGSMNPECVGGRCKVGQISNDGAGQVTDDTTFWQSAADPSCANQWIQSVFTQTSTVQNVTVEYDSLGPFFDDNNQNFQLVLNPTSSNPIDATSFLSCSTAAMANSGKSSRVTDCVMNPPQTNVDSVKLTWGLKKFNGTCQMNVDEIIMFGLPGATNTSSLLSSGAIAAISIASVVVVALGVLFGLRQRNLRLKNRERTGRFVADM